MTTERETSWVDLTYAQVSTAILAWWIVHHQPQIGGLAEDEIRERKREIF